MEFEVQAKTNNANHKDLTEKMNNQLPDTQKELVIKVDFTKPSNTYNPEFYKSNN
ncbi:hypothetical protein [Acinetobacter seifertii]|uniref:hypothetical protein n=1 Tax=Acinetobacter seifertii TaxID=1530123 RepID=UPI00148F4147|nr:hypothetical protein [Acinetobacter seifertii]